MSRDTWGPEGPPDEAYSRVTNPERFQPLHEAALRLLDRLGADFDVEMSEGYGLCVMGISEDRLTRPSIGLIPNDPECAPITVAFTDFPGVRVRFGKWKEEPFPDCGCDACDEDADTGIDRMTEMFESVIAGGFREAVRITRSFGDGWRGSEFTSPGRRVAISERAARIQLAKESARVHRVFRDKLEESSLSELRMLSESRVERSRALEMTGGRLYLEFDWKPWPRHR